MLFCCRRRKKRPPLRLILSSIFDFCFQDIDFRGHVVGIIIPKTVKSFEHSRYAVKKKIIKTKKMDTIYKIEHIEGKNLGCVALIEIKKG